MIGWETVAFRTLTDHGILIVIFAVGGIDSNEIRCTQANVI